MNKKINILLLGVAFLLASCSVNGTKSTFSNDVTTSKEELTEAKETTTKKDTETTTSTEETITTTTTTTTTETTYGEKGTVGNPYTVAEALEVIGSMEGISSDIIHVTGIVQGTPSFNSKYKSYNAYLVDKKNSKTTLEVYSGTVDSKAGQSDVKEGDVVVAYGYYTYYAKNHQPELAGDNNHAYPVFSKIERSSSGNTTNNFETLEDDGRATITTVIEFNEENMANEYNDDTCTWTKDNVSVQFDEGTQYSWTMNVPYRFYVGSYMHIRTTKAIKYIAFETNTNYPFYTQMPVKNANMQVESSELTYLLAKKGANYIKIHNSNNGEVKNVYVKQVRITKMTIVTYE